MSDRPWLHGFRRLVARAAGLDRIERAVDNLSLSIGRMEARRVRSAAFQDISEAEFRVFSQWGEDGIIQFLLGRVEIPNEVFVELGVQDYSESNTRFLLQNDNWRGVICDAGVAHQRFLRYRGLDWRHDIRALRAFITRENIQSLLASAGVSGDVGLMSIDLDGNDYWILEAVDSVSPRILVLEYNSLFGPEATVTVPYDAGFVRASAHHSNLYFGASLAAMTWLAERKGYRLVGSNSAGCNAFFVRGDVMADLRPVTARQAWVRSRHREGRDASGRLTLSDDHASGLDAIRNMPVVDIVTGRTQALGQALADATKS